MPAAIWTTETPNVPSVGCIVNPPTHDPDRSVAHGAEGACSTNCPTNGGRPNQGIVRDSASSEYALNVSAAIAYSEFAAGMET